MRLFRLRIPTVVLVCGALFLLTGCGSGSRSGQSDSTTVFPDGSVLVTGRYKDFNFTAASPKQVYSRGEAVPLTFSVENTSRQIHSVVVNAVGGNQYIDGAVYSESGAYVGTVLSGSLTPGSVNLPLAFEAKTTRSFTLSWQQQTTTAPYIVPAGRYYLSLYVVTNTLDGQPVQRYALGANPLEIIVQ